MQKDRYRYTSLGIDFSFYCSHDAYRKHREETQANDPSFNIKKNAYLGFLLPLIW